MNKNHPKYINRFLSEAKEQIYSGGNSNVYISKYENELIIVKKYSRMNRNWRIRIEREIQTMILLQKNSFNQAPRLIGYNIDEAIVICTYIDGIKMSNRNITEAICHQIDDTLRTLTYKSLICKNKIKFASNAFINPETFFSKILDRMHNTEDILENTILDTKSREREKFTKFMAVVREELVDSIKNYENSKDINMKALDFEQRIFSFSDVGSHNCILSQNKLHYIDFEHAGWDDPAKAYCDWIMRPIEGLEIDFGRKLVSRLISDDVHGECKYYRIKNLIPIINIQWILIRTNYQQKINCEISSEELEEIYKENKNKIIEIFS